MRRSGGALAAAALVAAVFLSLPSGEARASAYDCYGDMSGGLPKPRQTSRKLLFGIFPGGRAGAVVGPQKEAKPDDPAKILDALARLRSGRPFVTHLYLEFTGGPDMPGRIAQAEALIERYTRAGLSVEYVLPYRPQGRRGAPDVAAFVAFTRDMVRRLGSRRGVKAIQVTNEVNNSASPEASDGAYPGALDALVQGVIAAKDEARRRNLLQLEIGFNWFYRMPPNTEQEFWSGIAAKGGRRFVDALDWVGLDAYPGTYFPPGNVLSRRSSMANAMSVLRECLMPIAGIPKEVPIHVTENGWPTGAGRSYEEQELALREMIGAVHEFRANYNVTDLRWFSLRDGDSSDPDFQQGYGLMRDDYTPKPAFGTYDDLVTRLGVPPAAARRAPPRLRVTATPRTVTAGRCVRFRFRATAMLAGRPRPVHLALIRFAHRRVRTDRHGRASIVVRMGRLGSHRVLAEKRAFSRGVTRVVVQRPARGQR